MTSAIYQNLREQYESRPYPDVPIDESPTSCVRNLNLHSFTNGYYKRNQRVESSEGKLILDAGCGTGYETLVLAHANPGAKIFGADLSASSIELAKQRLQHHGFYDAVFCVSSINDLLQLGVKFDYINCDDTLYFFENPISGLLQLKNLLKPGGIIRTNLHSFAQRFDFFQAQKLFNLVGLFTQNPGDEEINKIIELMLSLKDDTIIKDRTWRPEQAKDRHYFLMNYLIQQDKGHNVSDVFYALDKAGLEFISMTQPFFWEVEYLFRDYTNLPPFFSEFLNDASIEQRLIIYELMNPTHRLIDFLCGIPGQSEDVKPPGQWNSDDWSRARVYLQPQLHTEVMHEEFLTSLEEFKPFEINKELRIPEEGMFLDSLTAGWLYSLWDESQPMDFLIDYWQRLHPVNLVTGEPNQIEKISATVIENLVALESLGYVLIEKS